MASSKNAPPIHEHSPTCPFCTIAAAFPPVDPLQSDLSNDSTSWNPQKLSPPAYTLLATEHVVAFMDIAPLTRGHVLVSPRRHRVKVGDMSPEEMSEVGKLLPLVARAVIKAVLPDIAHRDADYNIVQNNGPGAAQVVPHVHFHIIPRPPIGYRPPVVETSKDSPPIAVRERTPSTTHTDSTTSNIRNQSPPARGKYSPAEIPTGLQRSYIQFGRGMRHELDEDDAEKLVLEMRQCIQSEWLESQANASSLPTSTDPDIRRASERQRISLGKL